MSRPRPSRSPSSFADSALRKLWSKLAPSSSRAALPAEDPADEEYGRMRRALRRALDRHPQTRSKLRHAAVVEKELKRRGAAAFDRLPTPFLYRASQQLAGIEREGDLLPLRREIDRVLAGRSSATSVPEDSPGATSAEFVSQVDVAEDGGEQAWREFQRLLVAQDEPSCAPSSQDTSA